MIDREQEIREYAKARLGRDPWIAVGYVEELVELLDQARQERDIAKAQLGVIRRLPANMYDRVHAERDGLRRLGDALAYEAEAWKQTHTESRRGSRRLACCYREGGDVIWSNFRANIRRHLGEFLFIASMLYLLVGFVVGWIVGRHL